MLWLGITVFLQAARPVASRVVHSVRIHAQWGGLGTPVNDHFTITRDGTGYRSERRPINSGDVERLLDAVMAAPVPKERGLAQLTAEGWLKVHVHSAYGVLTSAQGECSPAARKLFVDTFTSHAAAVAALRRHYGSFHTDDYPSLEVELQLENGTRIRIRTGSQHALMLPWNGPRGETWNPDVSRAVATILPETASLKRRLLDEDLAATLAWEIGEQIRGRWEELEERCLYSEIVARLQQHFVIERTYHAWPGEFAGHLRKPDLPRNLLIDVHIAADAGWARNVDTFFKQSEVYVARARSFVLSRKNTTFELEYFDGMSVREDSVQLHEINRPKDPNIKRVRAALNDCVLLRDHNDPSAHRNWLILPTGEVVDWEE